MNQNWLRFNKKAIYCFIDYETYNLCLNFCHNKPWQTGLLKVQGDDIIDSKDIIVNWKNPPRFESDMVWQIFRTSTIQLETRIKTTGMLESQAFEVMYQWLEESDYIVGHNVLGFDVYLMKEWCKLHSKPWRHWLKKIIDTNLLAKGKKLSIPYKSGESLIEYQYRLYHRMAKGVKTRLAILGEEYGISHEYDKLHDAIVDLDLNRKLWNKLKHEIEI